MNILRSLVSLSIITFVSRVLGFIRDMLIAFFFGVSDVTDAFFLAFKIPNVFRKILVEGAFNQTFIPILSNYKNKSDIKSIRNFISNSLGLLIVILSIIILLGIFFSANIVSIFAPGFIYNQKKLLLSITLLKIIFPFIFFISLGALAGSILNSWGLFTIPAYSSIILNISIIVFLGFISYFFNSTILALAWAIFIAGIIQVIYHIPYLKKINMLVIPKFNILDKDIIKIVKQNSIMMISTLINQFSILLSTISSSYLMSGSISWIYYADRLIEFISGIFGVSLSTILLPLLSKNITQNNKKEFTKLIDWALRLSCIIVIPSAVSLFVLSEPLIKLLFQYGKFSFSDVIMTKQILSFYAIGLIPFVLIKILLSGFYSMQDVKTPMKISIFILILTQFMNFIFIKIFKHAGFALSISISSWINFFLLYWKLYSKNNINYIKGWLLLISKITFAIIIMLILFFLNFILLFGNNIDSTFLQTLRMIFVCLTSGGGYLLTLFILGIKLNHFYLFISNRN